PKRKLHAAGDRRSLDRGDDRLAEREPRRTHRAAWHRAAVGGKFQGSVGLGIIARADAADGKAFQVRSGAERAALTPEDGNVRRVAVEGDKRFIQRLRMCGIDGVARLGARMNDREHAITALDANRHWHLLRRTRERAAVRLPAVAGGRQPAAAAFGPASARSSYSRSRRKRNASMGD